jgi:hypothetical protein
LNNFQNDATTNEHDINLLKVAVKQREIHIAQSFMKFKLKLKFKR